MADDSTTQSNCPPLSLADRLKIYAAKYLNQSQGGDGGTSGGTGGTQEVSEQNGVGIDVPVEASDYFRWRAFSSATDVQVTFYGRVRKSDRSIVPFAHTIDAPGGGAIQTKLVAAGQGILVGAAASIPVDSISSGSVSAVGEIGRLVGDTFTPHHLLFSGQLDDLTPLTSQVSTPTQATNRTIFRSFNVSTNQAVPYSTTITPTSGYRMRFTRLQFVYTCSAVAGTRMPELFFRQGGATFQSVFFPLSRTATQTGVYEASISGSISTVGNASAQPLNDSIYFYDAVEVLILDQNAISGADVVNPVFIRWEES